jgi:hypothetical protein
MDTERALQVFPSMCKQQCIDLEAILLAIDDFAATSLGLSSQGPQGYSAFIESRESLRSLIKETTKNYRLVI